MRSCACVYGRAREHGGDPTLHCGMQVPEKDINESANKGLLFIRVGVRSFASMNCCRTIS